MSEAEQERHIIQGSIGSILAMPGIYSRKEDARSGILLHRL
ncbi:MAG: hypothetical protein C5S49_03535 [Candidatus Methanogaster sp.]|nr:MAG: hypothetical protein C5S49_03535 [ANME-2 cluster archaeon]